MSELVDFSDLDIRVVPKKDAVDVPTYDKSIFYKKIGNRTIFDEVCFCKAFVSTNDLSSCDGKLYNSFGKANSDNVRRDILESLMSIGIVMPAMSKLIDRLEALLTDVAPASNVYASPNRIPVENGDLYLKKNYIEFQENMMVSRYRLPISFTTKKIGCESFKKWLKTVIYDDDAPAFQEMLGYLLVPTTDAQKCFIILGQPGNGKSVLEQLLPEMLGDSCPATMNIVEMLNNRFATAELQDRLVCYDDDMENIPIKQSGKFKNLVTAKGKTSVERKFKDPKGVRLYARLVGCANYMPSSLLDSSDGFYRRILAFQTKPLSQQNREEDFSLYNKILEEKDGIFQWALVGLVRLIKNNYKFSESQRSKQLVRQSKESHNNIIAFIEDEIEYGEKLSVSYRSLYSRYTSWCCENAETAVSKQIFRTYFRDRQAELNLRNSTNVKTSSGYARGYFGMGIKHDNQKLIQLNGG